jgi:clan AA aspartic protease (TIGR02281 family)
MPARLASKTLLLLLCYVVFPAYADCAPEKIINPSFAKSLKLASQGNVIEQRNVAVSYEVGYLVGSCFSNAYFWYRQAARQGDKLSAEWLARNDALIALMNGPECYGSACGALRSSPGTTGTAYAGEGGHFFAPLSINGKTINGMIDTGATVIALNTAGEAELGINFSQAEQGTSGTANGAMMNRIMTVSNVSVAGVSLDNVQVACCINSPVSLIGMSFLSRVRFTVAGNTMNFRKY